MRIVPNPNGDVIILILSILRGHMFHPLSMQGKECTYSTLARGVTRGGWQLSILLFGMFRYRNRSRRNSIRISNDR